MRDHENPRYERDRRGERDDSRRELYSGQDYARGSEGERGGSWGGQSRPGDYDQRGGEYEQGRQYGQGRRDFDEEADREGGGSGQSTQSRVMRFQRWNQSNPDSASRTGFNSPGFGEYGSAGPSYGAGMYGSGSGYGQTRYGQQGSGAGTGEHRGKGPKGYQRSDERLKEMICEKLTDDPSIDASEVTVEVQGQVVTLDGTVESRQIKYEIETLVEDCGAKDVTNNLKVSKSLSAQGRSAQGQSAQGQDNGSSSRSQDGQGSQNKESKSRQGTQTSGSKY